MSEREISAIDAIYLTLDKVKELTENVSSMKDTISELENKVYVLNSRISKLNKESNKPVNKESNKPPKAVSDNSLNQKNYTSSTVQENSGLILGKVKLYGYIKNSSMFPIRGVNIELYKDGKQVRKILTDKEGYWEARIPSGRYIVKYIHHKFKPVSKDITISDKDKEFEVR